LPGNPESRRIEEYKSQTGNDIGVQEFWNKNRNASVFKIGSKSYFYQYQKLLGKRFEHLQINFGCTGGQHRSVYSAIKTAEFIRQKFPGSGSESLPR
jgi:UPF0042 nucleotide-binding protein